MRKLRIITLVCFLLSAAALGASTAYQVWSEDKTIPVIDCPEEPLVLSVKDSGTEVLMRDVTAYDEKDGDLTDQLLLEGIDRAADGDITVSELAARTDYSCRHISRIFTEYFGYSPKTFCRLLRFHHTLYEIFQDPHRNNSEFITQIGYSDQAHFQREFKTFMGETPRRFGRRLIQQKF